MKGGEEERRRGGEEERGGSPCGFYQFCRIASFLNAVSCKYKPVCCIGFMSPKCYLETMSDDEASGWWIIGPGIYGL